MTDRVKLIGETADNSPVVIFIFISYLKFLPNIVRMYIYKMLDISRVGVDYNRNRL